MINTKIRKIRTVKVNNRGQLVIPEDMRDDFEIKGGSTLVIIEKEGELVLKKESEVFEALEDKFWKLLSREAVKRAWGKEDDVWDRIAKESG